MKRKTLAIRSAHKQDNPNINYIIEVYENDVELLGELPMTKQIARMTKGESVYPEEIFSKIADRVIEKVKEL